MARVNRNIAAEVVAAAVIAVIAGILLFNVMHVSGRAPATAISSHKIKVVAAENFWGSLVSQLCGIHCNTTSIVADPNADPHEYEASTTDAKLISNAGFVIVNGVGYDDWALKLLSAGSNANRTVLDVAESLDIPNGSNPHLWYSPTYVNATVRLMYLDLVKIDPSNASYYALQYANLTSSLKQVDGRISEIRQQFGGAKVAATEDVFVYLANSTGLDLVSPKEFMEAVAEGTDPSAQSLAEFQSQLESGNVSVLVYNKQTVTPLTQQMKQIAAEHNISIVGITEIIQPPDVTYQTWMNGELTDLQLALSASAPGH